MRPPQADAADATAPAPPPGADPTATDRKDGAAPILTFETFSPPSGDERAPREGSRRLGLLDALLAAALLVLALAVRWPFIERGETLLHSDEAIVGLMAQDIAAGERLPLYFYGQRYMGALEAYVVAAVSPLFDNPVHALRFAPASFFALMVAVQFLMLSRWYGRAGGIVGALVLLAASPMFTQWSISARGGYVEILLWGTLLLWAYSEWFARAGEGRMGNGEWREDVDATAHPSPEMPVDSNHRFQPAPYKPEDASQFAIRYSPFLLGALIGSGFWINPSIVLFVLPIAAHALLNRPLAALRRSAGIGPLFNRVSDRLRHATLPVAVLLAVLLLNIVWSVWVADGRVHSELLLGLLPKPLAAALLALAAAAALVHAARRTRCIDAARTLARRHAALILGILVGSAPALLYSIQTLVGAHALDPSLPLGLRPLWRTGETLVYLLQGLPLLFGADPRPFLDLVGVGRDTVVQPLDLVSAALVRAACWLVTGAFFTGAIVLLHGQRAALSRLFRLKPTHHSPTILLLLGLGGTLGLYVLGGCTLDFTTIRYLVPLWVFVPGLMAAIFVSRRFRSAAGLVPLCAALGWAVGQMALHGQLGAPHPLRALATAIDDRGIDRAVAEPLDAHLLSYLTRQKCRTIEFESFWPRLGHYAPLLEPDRPMDYIVETSGVDRTWDWIRGGWPGRPPPETRRFLWPKLRRVLRTHPGRVVRRERLCDGYERIRLLPPLADRNLRAPALLKK